ARPVERIGGESKGRGGGTRVWQNSRKRDQGRWARTHERKEWFGALLAKVADRNRLRWDRLDPRAPVLPEEEIPGHRRVSICHDKLSSSGRVQIGAIPRSYQTTGR